MGRQPFSKGRGRYGNFNRGPRRNERIRVPEIRVIGPDGSQVGVMQTREALSMAKQAGLDLVEISASARPPVCRIIDYGKFQYEQSKKDKDKKSTAPRLKEVKFRVRIDQHDYMTKLVRAESFLDKGSKLKITLMFRGREMEHKDIGFGVVERAIEDLSHMAKADMQPRLSGRNITVTLSPLPANKRKRKWKLDDDDLHDEEDDEQDELDDDDVDEDDVDDR
jgi:translation initiation factor IF-3